MAQDELFSPCWIQIDNTADRNKCICAFLKILNVQLFIFIGDQSEKRHELTIEI